jgi:energy-coupling factor transporter ATP-binding protein EcfA2
MFEDYSICPYTGLRPFTEDESIYFKGRDEHIEQATRQLEKNKFIMLTGASGDGKSSLVYAGIVPNAKAGFLKASFSNWAVVDFRPERTPLSNLSKVLAAQLGINAQTAETELKYGFSALVDMYKASKLYYDTNDAEWIEGDERSRNEMRRKAANLIILADQFEEFFTNPENFQKGVPSQEAMSVTNLLLETARIAWEEKLPIYVVITMRSDFIGQCAAFRGLPEYIGFSQFFVPRLNRKELREVIEEPAVLSGNTISRRLTERLIHDIVEGTDQLPILQHALNQIWKMADQGKSQMDLIHYAMVGGMKGNELPGDDADSFQKWFESLPEKVQGCYDQPSLQNVLNTHANKLYNQASDHLHELEKETVSDEDAKRIIATAFKCLTKIDDSRAVRNRMTLAEITNILNVPHLDFKKVGSVLDVFREPGNTLLRPFLDDVPVLDSDDVLDITHESLIRNWENLDRWATEEFDSYTISLDFEQQLNRWIESGKSDDFLLYIGPLTYFESWIENVKPNAAWIARYLKADLTAEEKLAKASVIQANAAAFLRRSARKHLVTRTIIRYGPKRIAAVLGGILILTLSSFGLKNYIQRQDQNLLDGLKETTLALATSRDVVLRNRVLLINEELRLGQTTIPEVLRHTTDPIEKINVAIGIATNLIYQSGNEPWMEIYQSLVIADSLIDTYRVTQLNANQMSRVLKEINDLRETLELGYFYSPNEQLKLLRQKNAERSGGWVLHILRTRPPDFSDINNLNTALEHAVNYRIFSAAEIKELIKILSPFEGKELSEWVSNNYKEDILAVKGFFGYGFKFNGLYQELAYLYAADGHAEKALQAVEILLLHNQNYLQGEYSFMADNASHIAACFYRYDQKDALDDFVAGYCRRKNVTEERFYAQLIARCKLYEFATVALDYTPRYDLNLNLGLEYSDEPQLDFFFTKYREIVNKTILNLDARKFYLALSFKDQGIIQLRKLEVAGLDSAGDQYLKLFDKAVLYYKSVDPSFLEEEIEMVEVSNNDNFVQARKFLFLFPDIRTSFHPNEPRLFHYYFVSGCFLKYLLKQDLIGEFYKTEKELRYIEIFLRDYHTVESDVKYTVSKRLSYELLADLERNLANTDESRAVNLNFLYLYAGHQAAEAGEEEQMYYYYSKLTGEKIRALLLNAFNPNWAFKLSALAVADLMKYDHIAEADKIVKAFDGTVNRSSLYAYAALMLLCDGIDDSYVDQLIDSARIKISQTQNLSTVQPNRVQFAYALAMRNGPGDIQEAYRAIKNVPFKFVGIAEICRSLADNGELYRSTQNMLDDISDVDAFFFSWNILVGYGDGIGISEETPQWNEYAANRLEFLDRPLVYVDENN